MIDHVVVELAPIREHALKAGDLGLQGQNVGVALDVRVRLDDGEQVLDAGRRGGGDGALAVDGVVRSVVGPQPGHLLEHLTLEAHQAAHGLDQARQLVVTLLEDDVDVGPGLVDALARSRRPRYRS